MVSDDCVEIGVQKAGNIGQMSIRSNTTIKRETDQYLFRKQLANPRREVLERMHVG